MKELEFKLKINATYDYVIFNGDNYQEVIDFVKKYHINGDDDFWALRPADIPNLDYGDLIKWWETTGEVKKDPNIFGGDHTYNTHNMNNLPIWRKDEMLHIITKSSRSGYVNNEFMKKNDGILVYGRQFMFLYVIDEHDIEDTVKRLVLDKIPFNCVEL